MLGGAGGHWAVGLCAANRRESGAPTRLHRLTRETTLGDAKTPLILKKKISYNKRRQKKLLSALNKKNPEPRRDIPSRMRIARVKL